MKCLRCESVELEIKARGEGSDIIEIDQCSECGGLWLDPQELKKLDDNFFIDMEEIKYTGVEASADDTGLTCPRCDSSPALTKCHPQSHAELVVDTCPECKGFWLDKGELEKLREVSDDLLIASLTSLDDDD
jgi:Zn-finger nucleic acid-binding protein